MATADPISGVSAPSAPPGNGLLVVLSALPPEDRETVLANLAEAFPREELLVASPDASPTALSASASAEDNPYPFRFLVMPAGNVKWTLAATDFANACQLSEKYQARAILMLGPDSTALGASDFAALANAVLAARVGSAADPAVDPAVDPDVDPAVDLAVPCYALPPYSGLVNSVILYPLTRALFGSAVRFPLASELCLSLRMARRLAATAQRFTAANQGDTPIWPVSEAAVAGFSVAQFPVNPRQQPHPNRPDLNTILPFVSGPLFADIDAKAAFWQRFRSSPPSFSSPPNPPGPAIDTAAEAAAMLQTFRLACTNLQEIWSLVLPPASLFGIKRLCTADAATFRMPDNLWARIVYDFLLAYRTRAMNRGHLLGALIPLYLAAVASHFNIAASGTDPERHIEALAAAFEAEKTYLLSRWRWPDRFNP